QGLPRLRVRLRLGPGLGDVRDPDRLHPAPVPRRGALGPLRGGADVSAAERALTPAAADRRPLGRALGRGGLYVLAIGLGAVFMVPYAWALGSSLKTPLEMTTIPPTWVPTVPQWRNYLFVTQVTPFLTFA